MPASTAGTWGSSANGMQPGVDDFSILIYSKMSDPSKRAYFGEGDNWYMEGCTYWNSYWGFASWGLGDPLRHGQKMNCWFLDGHAASALYTKAYLAFGNPSLFSP